MYGLFYTKRRGSTPVIKQKYVSYVSGIPAFPKVAKENESKDSMN
jgi:hypothetical protein